MKKIYYKVSSFFTEKRSTIIILLFVLSILFIPKNTYALTIDNTKYNTQAFADDLTTKLNNYLKYDNLIYYQQSQTALATANTNFFILPVKSTGNPVCATQNGSYYTLYELDISNNNTLVIPKVMRTTTTLLSDDDSQFSDIFSTFTNQNFNRSNVLFTSFDIKDCNDMTTTFRAKTFNYTPPLSGGSCPECEECQECEGGGPVEVSNFPLDKTDFYTLLVLLGVLIIMLFFKWCFPMKGGKKQQ